MVNINISITEEAYNFLKMLKGKDKSFSEIILEMKKRENKCNSVDRFFGVLSNLDWNEKENKMKELRTSFNKRLGSNKE